jgi:copper chaperone CopZ
MYVVDGLVCLNCSSEVKAALAKLDGVCVEAACHNTAQVLVKYDPAKVKKEDLVNAIMASGHPVTGEKERFDLPTLTDEAAAAVVEGALSSLPGVRRVTTSVGTRGGVVVLFDPTLVTRDRVANAINATPFKIATAP